jgi:putative transposase
VIRIAGEDHVGIGTDFTQDRDDAFHLDYIHFNPVKHGHAVRVQDWPYSSFRRWVRFGAYPVDWAGTVGDETARFGER